MKSKRLTRVLILQTLIELPCFYGWDESASCYSDPDISQDDYCAACQVRTSAKRALKSLQVGETPNA